MDRRSKTYLILATVVALLAICVAVWALFSAHRRPQPTLKFHPWRTNISPPRTTGTTKKCPKPRAAAR